MDSTLIAYSQNLTTLTVIIMLSYAKLLMAEGSPMRVMFNIVTFATIKKASTFVCCFSVVSFPVCNLMLRFLSSSHVAIISHIVNSERLAVNPVHT